MANRTRWMLRIALACTMLVFFMLVGMCVLVYQQPELPALLLAYSTRPEQKQDFSHIILPGDSRTSKWLNMSYCPKSIPLMNVSKFHGVWFRARDIKTWSDIMMVGAFFDDRPNIEHPVIRLFGVSTVPMNRIPYCYFWYKGLSQPLIVPLTSDSMVEAGRGYSHQGSKYTEMMYNCKLPDIKVIPEYVSLVFNKCDVSTSAIPVHVPLQKLTQDELGLCVAVSYGDIDPVHLIEWIEMNRLLGVSRIHMYNSSIIGPANAVLDYYISDGFVHVHKSAPPLSDWCKWCQKLAVIPMLNDCMYRYMYQYRYIMVIDLDEFIIPTSHFKITQLLLNLEGFTGLKRPSYMFYNDYFFLEYGPQVDDLSKNLLTMQYLLRTTPSNEGYAAKSIISPDQCIILQNHYCTLRTGDVGHFWTKVVDTDLAKLHHYKHCHFSMDQCKRHLADKHFDRTALRYQDLLLPTIGDITAKLQIK